MAFEIIRRWLSVSIVMLGLLFWLVFFALVALSADLSLLVRLLGLGGFSAGCWVGTHALDQATWKRRR